MKEYVNKSRRSFLAGTAGLAVAASAFSAGMLVGPRVATAATTLRIVTAGGNFEAALKTAMFDPYHAANPETSIVLDSPDDPARLKAMVEAGNMTADIWIVGDFFGLDTDGQWLEEIDYSRLDADAILPEYRMKYRVGCDIENTLITYRKDVFKDGGPQNFADFFDTKKFPGKRAVWKFASGGIFEAALLADGVEKSKLYPIDVDRALKKLDSIKEDLIWWDSGAQAVQLLTSGEAPIAFVWGSRSFVAMESAPVEISWGEWISASGWFTIPKGASNQDESYKAIKFFLAKEQQIAMTRYLPYGPVNIEAAKSPDPKYKGNLPTDHLDTRVSADHAWWAENLAAVDERFQEWLLS